ncbi:hypothetical protein T484DRAFT_1803357 [Baffinella frigidus]|nr:hypothetical protein T484DRAFT_1803357 [Cryptophyta sp. CCMP2293]
MSNVCRLSRRLRHLGDLDRKLGALELREDGTPECHSPFQYASDGEDSSSSGELRAGGKGQPQPSKAHQSVAQEQAAPSAQSEGGPWARVVVSPMPQFRVQKADARWHKMFGFSSSDVQNKSLRMACGPQTKMQVLRTSSLVASSWRAPEFVTLYAKSGEEISLVVRAKLEGAEGHIAFEMRPLDAASSATPDATPEEDLEEEAAVYLSSQSHTVSCANAACEALLGVSELQLKKRGMTHAFSEQTSRMRWNNLVKGAAEGATRSCLMSLRGATGINTELVVLMEVSPDTATPRVARLYPTVVVRMRLPPHDPQDAPSAPSWTFSAGSSLCSSFEESCSKSQSSSLYPASPPRVGASHRGSQCGDFAGALPSQGAVLTTMGSTSRAHLRAFMAMAKGRRKCLREESAAPMVTSAVFPQRPSVVFPLSREESETTSETTSHSPRG